MENFEKTGNEKSRLLNRRDFLQKGVGAALGLGSIYLVGCATAQPTPTPTKSAATAVATAGASPTKAAAGPTATPRPPVTVTMSTTATADGLLNSVIEAQKLDQKYGLSIKISVFDAAGAEQD